MASLSLLSCTNYILTPLWFFHQPCAYLCRLLPQKWIWTFINGRLAPYPVERAQTCWEGKLHPNLAILEQNIRDKSPSASRKYKSSSEVNFMGGSRIAALFKDWKNILPDLQVSRSNYSPVQKKYLIDWREVTNKSLYNPSSTIQVIPCGAALLHSTEHDLANCLKINGKSLVRVHPNIQRMSRWKTPSGSAAEKDKRKTFLKSKAEKTSCIFF